MLKFFYKNKSRYEKGQVAPYFIVLIVVIIIMAMVTVNLSKVALIKTETSNAADAGAIAAGSAMASLFNSLAQANSYMITAYEEFYVEVSVLFAEALVYLISAHTSVTTAVTALTTAQTELDAALTEISSAEGYAYPIPGVALAETYAAIASVGAAMAAMGEAVAAMAAAITSLGSFIETMYSILISVTAFWGAQWYIYCNLRDVAEEGRYSTLKMGHGYAFSNSGTAGKLTDSQKDNFEDFTDAISDDDTPAETYTYSWSDGQGRGHSVTTNVTTQLLDHFQLQVTVLPFPVEEADLIAIIVMGNALETTITTVKANIVRLEIEMAIVEILLWIAVVLLGVAQVCEACSKNPYCAACWVIASTAAEVLLAVADGMVADAAAEVGVSIGTLTATYATFIALYAMIAAAWAGLLPGYVVDSYSCEDAWTWIICWIDEVVHDRLVTVSCSQGHGGGDYGFWQTSYPSTYSAATVNFQGNGDIYEPVLRHDASIISVE